MVVPLIPSADFLAGQVIGGVRLQGDRAGERSIRKLTRDTLGHVYRDESARDVRAGACVDKLNRVISRVARDANASHGGNGEGIPVNG